VIEEHLSRQANRNYLVFDDSKLNWIPYAHYRPISPWLRGHACCTDFRRVFADWTNAKEQGVPCSFALNSSGPDLFSLGADTSHWLWRISGRKRSRRRGRHDRSAALPEQCDGCGAQGRKAQEHKSARAQEHKSARRKSSARAAIRKGARRKSSARAAIRKGARRMRQIFLHPTVVYLSPNPPANPRVAGVGPLLQTVDLMV